MIPPLLINSIAESESRGATILYATHIFDGIGGFPTHIAHMRDGSFVKNPQPWPLAGMSSGSGSLHDVALAWLREDREDRRVKERSGVLKKVRGARKVRCGFQALMSEFY